MGRKSKYRREEKINLAEQYLNESRSMAAFAKSSSQIHKITDFGICCMRPSAVCFANRDRTSSSSGFQWGDFYPPLKFGYGIRRLRGGGHRRQL